MFDRDSIRFIKNKTYVLMYGIGALALTSVCVLLGYYRGPIIASVLFVNYVLGMIFLFQVTGSQSKIEDDIIVGICCFLTWFCIASNLSMLFFEQTAYLIVFCLILFAQMQMFILVTWQFDRISKVIQTRKLK